MDALINDTTALVFDARENIGDGVYVQLMNNLKEMYKLKDSHQRRTKVPRTIPDILRAWIDNEQGTTPTGSFSTAIGNLYSYNLQIGYTRPCGCCKGVVDHTAGGLGFVSQTTSTHVGKTRRYCGENGILLRSIGET